MCLLFLEERGMVKIEVLYSPLSSKLMCFSLRQNKIVMYMSFHKLQFYFWLKYYTWFFILI